MITEPHDEQLAAPAQDHVTSAVDHHDPLTQQLAAGLADPKLERWHRAPALTTPHSRRSAQRDPLVAREAISASVCRAASAGMSAPGLEVLPQPRATHDAEKGLAATRRWQTLTRAQGTRFSAGPRR